MAQRDEAGDRSGSSGMSNADFARMFRREARSGTVDTAASASGAPQVSGDNSTDDNDDDVELPRGMGMDFGSARSNFMALGQPPPTSQLESDSTERTTMHTGGLGLGLGVTAAVTTQEPPAATRREAPAMSCAQLASLGKWEKHTKGFGMKMLAKMGFKGRLGKDEQGVSATVEVVQRPALMGIGFGNFTEASALRHNRRLQRELRGDADDADADDVNTANDNNDVDDDSLWRKRSAPLSAGSGGRTKRSRRSADGRHSNAGTTQAAATAATTHNDVVLDMRGPDVRVLANVAAAYTTDGTTVTASQPKLGDELIYNVHTVVLAAQSAIGVATAATAQSAARLASIEKEVAMLDAQTAIDSVRLQHVESLLQRVQALEAVAAAATRTKDVRGLLDQLSTVRAASPTEFAAYKLQQLAAALCVAPLESLFASCDFATRDAQHDVVEQLSALQHFLLDVSSTTSASSPTSSAVFHYHIHEKVSEDGAVLYNAVLEQTLWPALRQFVATHWRVRTQPRVCIELLEQLAPFLPQACADAVHHQLVLPRLATECERWQPQRDSATPIHDWLLPWRHVLGAAAMQTLYPATRLALAHALTQWYPSDLSVRALLAPWRAMWGEHEYAKFTHRHVVRKLVRCLHRDFVVDPAHQSLDALTWVLAWQRDLPTRQFVALLEGEFFPLWLSVLRQWIATPDAIPRLVELVAWYSGWKRFFDQHDLVSHARLVVHVHGALVLLEAACDRFAASTTGTETAVSVVPRLNRSAPTSYQDALVQARIDDPAAEDGASSANDDAVRASAAAAAMDTASQKPKRTASHAVGLKDVIENLAIAHNMLFLPRGVHDGQQVYAFGKHHIVIDQGVVYVERTKGAFEPVDIEQLL